MGGEGAGSNDLQLDSRRVPHPQTTPPCRTSHLPFPPTPDAPTLPSAPATALGHSRPDNHMWNVSARVAMAKVDSGRNTGPARHVSTGCCVTRSSTPKSKARMRVSGTNCTEIVDSST
eukprot:3432218-Rhodomonas_salina.1